MTDLKMTESMYNRLIGVVVAALGLLWTALAVVVWALARDRAGSGFVAIVMSLPGLFAFGGGVAEAMAIRFSGASAAEVAA